MSGESAEELHLAAVLAKLRAAGSTAHDVDELHQMTTKPVHYNEVHLMERLPQNLRLDGTTGARAFTIFIRSVGQEYINAQWERERAREALLWQFLTVAGVETGGIAPALDNDAIAPDEGWYSGTSEYVYTT